jgi:hypothetical protein
MNAASRATSISVQVLITQEFPEQFQVVGSGSDRIRAAIQVVQELQIGKDRLNWYIVVIKDQLAHAIRKAYSLYLHRLHPFVVE